jgi:hypothetical protein
MLYLQMMNNQPLVLKNKKHCNLKKKMHVCISLQVAIYQLPLQSNLIVVCQGLVYIYLHYHLGTFDSCSSAEPSIIVQVHPRTSYEDP